MDNNETCIIREQGEFMEARPITQEEQRIVNEQKESENEK